MELCKRDNQKEVCESLAWQNKYLGDNDMNRRCLIIFCFFIMTLCGCSKIVEQQITEQMKLGQKYLLEHNYEEAIIAFHKVIELDAKNMEAYQGLELAYEGAENYKGAECNFECLFLKTIRSTGGNDSRRYAVLGSKSGNSHDSVSLRQSTRHVDRT